MNSFNCYKNNTDSSVCSEYYIRSGKWDWLSSWQYDVFHCLRQTFKVTDSRDLTYLVKKYIKGFTAYSWWGLTSDTYSLDIVAGLDHLYIKMSV